MALEKPVPTPYGVDATYFKILRKETNYSGQDCVYVAGYVSEEERWNNKEPLIILTYIGDYSEQPREQIYPDLKASKPELGMDGQVIETNLLVDAIDLL